MSDRYVKFAEYERAIINLKKMIQAAQASAEAATEEHIVLDANLHPDTKYGEVERGDLIHGWSPYGAVLWTRLPIGAESQVLTVKSGLPAWYDGGPHDILNPTIHTDVVGPEQTWDRGNGYEESGEIQGGDILIVSPWNAAYDATKLWLRLPIGEKGRVLISTDFSATLGCNLPQWGPKITISENDPSGGENGDLWFKVG